ncbi:hypothetical protein MNQ98_07665 [Paenibacillus sp. N3/727]|uniref:hypothetical protein n=1 Tax=Paenibacillus sp. N3/727 TaxID=2925845 RepID=UPI001F535855|nr:hypothetical protein [Paenibacillus sp. N3/727]UNK19883.1 hypothetical protein MNQ98_07665 [Paenibacillus sp. N3/727]
MRQSPKSAGWSSLSLLASGAARETESINRSVVLPADPIWKMDVKASDRIFLPRT